ANTVFNSGTQIGSSGWYCVYNNTGTGVTISGLTPSTNYRAMVVEYNDGGLTNVAQYNTNTATNNPRSFITQATLTGITRAGVLSTVSSSTVDYNIVFGSAVSNLTTLNFTPAVSGLTGATVTAVNGSGSAFTVTVNTG